MRGAVIVAKGDQWTNLKPTLFQWSWTIIFLHLVSNNGGVLAVNHEHGLLNFPACYFVGEARECIEPECFEISKTLRMYHAGVAIGRKFVCAVFNENNFLEFREQNETTHGRVGCRDEEAMIAPVDKA